ncbi:MAG: hybrid sensor histidine kinase/response regulator [Verrucomicrobia bacterium]|nr:hybrid sensor histidine kinase/response regulator [Verrucomicrobiota bacterium]
MPTFLPHPDPLPLGEGEEILKGANGLELGVQKREVRRGMDTGYDYKKFGILYVDDEENSLKYFARAFDPQFRIFTAASAAEGFRIFQDHRDQIALLMTDQRMPGEQGVQLLERARHLCPRTLRILVTAYADINAAIDAVNSGAIYKYIAKPWRIPELEVTLRRGLEFFIVQRERDQLLKEKLSMIQNFIIADRLASLGVLAAGLNHHLRNSLVAIRTFLDLAPSKLRDEAVDPERSKDPKFWSDFHTHVQTQVQRITEMLTEFSETAQRSDRAFQQEVSLADVVSRAADRLQVRLAKKRVALDLDFPGSLPPLRVDKWKFQRLFELLLGSELLNVPENSRIVLRARAMPEGDASPRSIELEIRDQSPCLPANALASMFDPFLARAGELAEYGINLLICYFIVYHHGGKVECKSQAGPGVTFALTLPCRPEFSASVQDDQRFLAKVLWNEALWEKMIAGN